MFVAACSSHQMAVNVEFQKGFSKGPRMQTHSEMIRAYIRAKDENRPHLMRRIFAETATLEMVVQTGTISFPPISRGVDTITQVLVRDFGKTFENVYTFCLTDAPSNDNGPFSCNWLVGMSEKETGTVRVGCGRYDWIFQTGGARLVEKLSITIHLMLVLSGQDLRPVMDWLSKLPYPWCPAEKAANGMPSVPDLKPAFDYINRVRV